ncbi:MAG: hypothetical protein ACRDJH_19380 [Thermomicrobiales bacterium]
MIPGKRHAGVSRSTITPPIGTQLTGFAGRESGCTSVHDDLFATALVLAGGETRLALLTCDLIAVHPTVVADVRRLVDDNVGIPGDHLMLCCSHTHAGPPTFATPETAAHNRHYVERLPALLAATVAAAAANLQPARLGHGSGHTAIGANRRQLRDGRIVIGEDSAGLCDHELGLLRLERPDGSPLALVVNATSHPVILGPANLAVSADFVGVARAQVEAATSAPMLFIQGACADINPRDAATRGLDSMIRAGDALAADILSHLYGFACTTEVALLSAARMDVDLPLRQPIAGEPPPALALSDDPEKVFPWEIPMTDNTIQMEVQAFSLGDLGIVALACEPFVATGMACKQASPFARTFVAGYANGNVGYIPTADEYPRGGYEVTPSHLYYRLPQPVAPEAEALVVQTARSALNAVAGHS